MAKTPLKRRSIVRHNFDPALGGLKSRSANRTAQAVGAAGTVIGDNIGLIQFSEPNKTGPDLSKLEGANFNVEAKMLEGDTSIFDQLTGKPFEDPRPKPSIQNIPAKNPTSKNPYESMHGPITEEMAKNNPWLAGGYADQPKEPFQLQQFGNVGAYTPHTNALPGSPLKRVHIGYTGPDAPSSAGVSYLGQAGAAAAEAHNAALARHEYKRKVWEDKAAEADQEFGKLQVAPSGVSTWDASVENMAREWKSELGDLLRNKHDYSPDDFVNKKNEILARSKQFNDASAKIQQVVADYNENLDNISPSTDPEILDVLNTLSKGGGELGVGNVDGVPTLSGYTNGGQLVSIPLSEISSGRNQFRFNTKVDVQGPLNKIANSLAKIKTDRETTAGLTRGTVGWDQLSDAAGQQIDNLLNNPATVRSILADRYGYDYDDYNDKFFGNVETARLFAKQQLMDDIQQQVAPYQQAQQIVQRGDVTAINEAREAQAESAKALAAQRFTKAEDLQKANEVEAYGATNEKYDVIYKDGKYYAREKGDDNNKTLKEYATFEELKAGTPLKRSPFKRLMNYFKGK